MLHPQSRLLQLGLTGFSSGLLLGLMIVLPLRRTLAVIRTEQTLLAVSDEVLPPGAAEGFQHQRPLFRTLPLHQRPLHGLFVGIGGHIHFLHGAGIDAGIVHTGGQGAGSGVEILHLLGLPSALVEPLGQLNRILQGTARVTAHEVRHQILLLAVLLVEPLVLIAEFFVHFDMGLAHVVQHRIHTVLRGHLQLSGNMIFHQFGKKFAALVLHHVVKADAGTDEDLLDTRNGAQLPEEFQVIGMVGVQIGAGLGGKASPVFTKTVLLLLGAGEVAEIGGGPAHVVDVTLKAGVLR